MNRPLPLAVSAWFARRFGHERFSGWLRTSYGLALLAGPQRMEIEAVLRRILRYGGAEPSPESVRRLVAELIWIYADNQATLHLLDRALARGLGDRIDLALLPELSRLREGGKGVILATPHFGNTVLAMTALGLSGVPLSVQVINAEAYLWAEDFGVRMLDLGNAASDCLRALAANEALLMFCDLDFFPGARSAPLFGAPVRPPHGVARLCLASGAPVLPFYTIHQGGGRYRAVCDAPIVPVPGLAQEEIESRLLGSLETALARHPAHWWVLRDIWDLDRCDRLNQRHLAVLAFIRRLKSLIHA